MTRRPPRHGRRPRVERLESRALLAAFVVTNTADSGVGSLRTAIAGADGDPAADTSITFAIPGPGVRTIAPKSPLPVVTRAVLIDGTSQPGYVAANGPSVAIDGSGVAPGSSGLELTGGSIVRGLAIVGFVADARSGPEGGPASSWAGPRAATGSRAITSASSPTASPPGPTITGSWSPRRITPSAGPPPRPGT